VIRNPEVQKLVKPLLLAIANPNKHAKPALDTLLQTVFINTVDAPSLALIVPVVHRGLRDRSGDAKKKAARIVGNMCALINEPKVRRSLYPWQCSGCPHPTACSAKAQSALHLDSQVATQMLLGAQNMDVCHFDPACLWWMSLSCCFLITCTQQLDIALKFKVPLTVSFTFISGTVSVSWLVRCMCH